jgi:hypothetical protein
MGGRDRWRLTETLLPLPRGGLPPHGAGAGRLVRVTVQHPGRALFSGRHALAGRGLTFPVLAELTGEALVEGDQLRLAVYAPAASVLVVAALSGIFLLGGLQVFLARPGLGTVLGGGALVAVGAWLLSQIRQAGRDVAADAAQVLQEMSRAQRPGAESTRGTPSGEACGES